MADHLESIARHLDGQGPASAEVAAALGAERAHLLAFVREAIVGAPSPPYVEACRLFEQELLARLGLPG